MCLHQELKRALEGTGTYLRSPRMRILSSLNDQKGDRKRYIYIRRVSSALLKFFHEQRDEEQEDGRTQKSKGREENEILCTIS